MMSTIIHNSIKMTLASLTTILLAQLIGLDYPITAGILAVLSIQKTRTDSLLIAMKRLLSSLLALSLSTLLFFIMGYNLWVFTLFTALFIFLSFGLKISVGIVPSLVLVSHILQYGTYSLSPLFNGLGLMIIAILVALSLNLVYPMNTKKHLELHKKSMDMLIKEDIKIISNLISDNHNEQLKSKHDKVNHDIEKILKEAELLDRDLLFDQKRPLIKYIKMRYEQMRRLDRVVELSLEIQTKHPYIKYVSEYIHNLYPDIGESNQALKQKNNLKNLLDTFRKKALPKTREAFETRAILFQILYELDGFLDAKIHYHNISAET